MKRLRILVLLGLPGTLAAQTVYRCPGPPVLYTDAVSPAEAQAKGCKALDGAPVSVLQVPRVKPAPAALAKEAAVPAGGPAGAGGGAKVDAGTQKLRDSDRRLVLETELRAAEKRLAELQAEYAGGQPERRGDERNYAKYLERVAELKASVSRQEQDIAALRREIGKLN